jgi:O-antigen biosynthesis protein
MTALKADSPDTETLRYLWTPHLDPLFWRDGRTSVSSAWYGHVPFAHWIVGVAKPRALVELGTQNGVSYSAFCEAVARNGFDTRCYAVDTWQGDDQTGHYGEEIFLDFRRFHDHRYRAFSELLRCTFDDALAYIPNGSVDLLHIDGLHTYEAVRHDFEGWRPRLSESAVVLFHDTNVRERDFGVWRLWQELRMEFPGFEFLHGHGLGVLAFGRSPSPQVSSLCSLRDSSHIHALRERFSMLGERWVADQRERLQGGEVAARDARILSLEGEVAARDARILSLEGEVAARDARILLLEGEVTARDARILSLDGEVAARDARILSLEGEVAARDARILSLEGEVTPRAARILSLEGEVAARDARILSLEAEVDEVKAEAACRSAAEEQLAAQGAAQAGMSLEVILVDSYSRDGTAQQLARAILRGLGVLRDTGNRLTWGGLRSLTKRVVTEPLRGAVGRPFLKTIGRSVLCTWRRSLQGEVAARDARIRSLEGEVAVRNTHIRSLEAEVEKAKAEAACRNAAEEESRSRVAQRTLEIATAMIRVNAVKAKATPAPLIAKAPDIPTEHVDKLRIVKNLTGEFADFLASGSRLSFPAGDRPDVSVIVVLFNQAHFALHCLRAVLAQVGVSLELILVDNCSTDGTAQLLTRLENVRVLRNRQNTGYLLAVNQAAAEARGRTILLLNSDAFMHTNALAIALQTLESDDRIGAVGGKLVLPSGRVQEAGSIIWSDASTQGYGRNLRPEAGEAMFRRDVDYCSAAFLLTRRTHFDEMGRFDPVYAPAYYEDADYCMRLWAAGLRVVYEPRAVINHYESGSETHREESISLVMRNRKHLRLRHSNALQKHLPASDGNLLCARGRFGPRRRLLVIDNEVPLSVLGSGYPRMRAILNEAVAAGWLVTFYPLQLPDVNWEAAYAELSPEIEICDGRGVPGLAGFLAERLGYYDAMLVSRPDNMALFNDAVRHQPHVIASSRLIYDAEALFAAREILRARVEGRPMSESESKAMILQEINLTANVDSVVAVSGREAQLFCEHQGATVHVLSHSTAATWEAPGFDGRTGFLFIGRLLEKEAPNYQGLTWFLQWVWPEIRAALYQVSLTVVGAVHPESTELEIPGVRLLGKVDDLRPLYDRARVFVSPIRFSAGLPIKILEAAAAGLPVVGTELMAAQLGWEPGVEIEAVDDPAQMALKAVALYGNGARWESVQTAALLRLSREHSATVFGLGLRTLLAGDPRSAAPAAGPDDAIETHRIARVNSVWSASEGRNGRGEPWVAHPMVRACINRRASGDSDCDAYGRLIELLTAMGWELPVETAVSLCCGAGELERGLAGLRVARRIVGYDLAKAAISKATAQAAAAGLSHLEYEVRDLERDGIGQSNVDLIFAHSAVHHVSRLEALFDNVHAALRPGGIFHLNEYVGPDRFQWTEKQLAEINDFLRNLPERYRRLSGGGLRSCVSRPTIEEMLKHDPSEAARSSQIEALTSARFHIVERRALGGTLLHMALSDIAQNFDPDKKEDQAYIQQLIDREERLMAEDDLESDFLVLVAQRKE